MITYHAWTLVEQNNIISVALGLADQVPGRTLPQTSIKSAKSIISTRDIIRVIFRPVYTSTKRTDASITTIWTFLVTRTII